MISLTTDPLIHASMRDLFECPIMIKLMFFDFAKETISSAISMPVSLKTFHPSSSASLRFFSSCKLSSVPVLILYDGST